jgi:thiamine phosphate synthase YjbQ (UPF0047 family)
MVKTETIKVNTKGNCDVVNITEQVSEAVAQSNISDGTVTVFNVGSTAGITTTEYEPGLVKRRGLQRPNMSRGWLITI